MLILAKEPNLIYSFFFGGGEGRKFPYTLFGLNRPKNHKFLIHLSLVVDRCIRRYCAWENNQVWLI